MSLITDEVGIVTGSTNKPTSNGERDGYYRPEIDDPIIVTCQKCKKQFDIMKSGGAFEGHNYCHLCSQDVDPPPKCKQCGKPVLFEDCLHCGTRYPWDWF